MAEPHAASIVALTPDWPAPGHVRAYSTTRLGGVGKGVYRSLNLATHVGDAPASVAANRRRLAAALALPGQPLWLTQVHATRVVDVDGGEVDAGGGELEADGAVSRRSGRVCAVLTADCLPVLLCDRRGTRVAALHAGWRGLAAGILEAGVAALDGDPKSLLAWIGPGIGGHRFEVGAEVLRAFVALQPEARAAFRPSAGGRWLADLAALARLRLKRAGVGAVVGGRWCTYDDARHFFSYRRDGTTGRMATLIWMDAA